jgi:hypothetical protein
VSHDGELLIGALLDRLGKRGARTLLTQLDQWLTAETQTNINRFDRNQIGAIEGPYDRRKQDGTELTFDTQSRRR